MAVRMVARRLGSNLLMHRFTPAAILHSNATSFGSKEVNEQDKCPSAGKVASNYDVMNDLMSFGVHRLWKERFVSKLSPFPGMKHLDVAGGTGDIAFRIMEKINSVDRRAMEDSVENDSHEKTQIYVCDINPNMLDVGRIRAQLRGFGDLGSLVWVEGDAHKLNFEDGSMDGYTIAFGIRKVKHIEKVLAEAYRVLKKGGRFLCLELSHVEESVFKQMYEYYISSVIPVLGELVAGDRDAYQNFNETICRFPTQEVFASMIADAGFGMVEYENLVGGVVAIHTGLKL